MAESALDRIRYFSQGNTTDERSGYGMARNSRYSEAKTIEDSVPWMA